MLKVRLIAVTGLMSLLLSGCASLLGSVADPGNELRIREDSKPAANARPDKYPFTVRISGYSDGRQVESARWVGISTSRIAGLAGKDLVMDRDASEVVAESVKKRMGDAGFRFVAADAPAQFLLSGVVKQLNIDVKDRDYVNIAVESNLTEVSSGKVIWSGVVVEKAQRFAGTSGNTKKDVADYLHRGLSVVSTKTSESILSVLMSARPELFNLEQGVAPVQGVTVLSNTAAAVPAVSEAAVSNGTLAVTASPARAKVYVDGVYFGVSPLRAEVAVGVHEVSVKMDGYQAESEKVSVRKGNVTELEMTLHR